MQSTSTRPSVSPRLPKDKQQRSAAAAKTQKLSFTSRDALSQLLRRDGPSISDLSDRAASPDPLCTNQRGL
ncbi:hypothetical protein AAFF_G00167620 [Aldrovandia affinis]|uniref:Uncharacterized protein n=1 Tax=Aldrovandia affinis TaxID=143900 RepID=A0AAD7RPL3_9TELE|nr:hypothetical protein AAFF_G00167620 [Aldrovandia affinis]